MNGAVQRLILAVDGGGTRCRVAADDGRDRWLIETGPANVSTDLESAADQIVRGVQGLAEMLCRPADALFSAPAFLGIAGVTGPDVAQRLGQRLPFTRVRIEDDRPAALRGVLGDGDGVLAHCGTGSFFASQIAGRVRLSGGWGPVLGDEASAQWVGRLALHRTLDAVDGMIAVSPLSEYLLNRFADAAGVVRFGGEAEPSDFGAIAPLVTEFASRGDPVALRIMQDGALEIVRAIEHHGWRPGVALCLTGGIGPFYADHLPEEMRGCLQEPAGEPLDGAVALAHEFAAESEHVRN